ncbi:MAG TPA: PepSY-associated TM helix domain-containing protein [Kofleriaceae bacterium]|nr:PepSY-associated TM helix domain-containing protein [Kofleriaceae bacterium]
MADLAEEAVPEEGQGGKPKARPGEPPRGAQGRIAQLVKKRWRAWLRAVHRDVGYLAVGFTIIYALSGIAMNHLEDWDPNFRSSEVQLQITPIADDLSDDEAVARIAAAAGMSGTPSDVLRAGDEVRLEYPNGSKVTAIGDTVTVQKRESRFFFRIANWLHATRGKAAWKYIADAYAVLLLYLAISGIFMIKGRLGLRWRGALLIGAGLAVPLAYIVIAGGPDSQQTTETKVAAPAPGEDGIRYLPPEPEPAGAGAPAAEDDEAPQRPPVLKPPPEDGEAPQRPPVLEPPPPEGESAVPQRPPVLEPPPAGA